jgi:hypothetical protein
MPAFAGMTEAIQAESITLKLIRRWCRALRVAGLDPSAPWQKFMFLLCSKQGGL